MQMEMDMEIDNTQLLVFTYVSISQGILRDGKRKTALGKLKQLHTHT